MVDVFDAGPDLRGRTILAVFAHPDDESLACGGTLARLADAGARIVVRQGRHPVKRATCRRCRAARPCIRSSRDDGGRRI